MPMGGSVGLDGRLLGGRECGAVAFAGFGSMGRWVSVSVRVQRCSSSSGRICAGIIEVDS